MKRFTAFILSAALLLPSALAAGTGEKFPTVNVYPGYADVAETDWFYDNAKLCYEIGLMTGTDKGFEPGKPLTIGECTAIAARIRSALTGEPIPPMEGAPWYLPYAEYIRAVDPILTGVTAHADDNSTRYEFLRLLDAAVSGQAGLLEPINEVAAPPDCEDGMVLEFYRAGILTGKDRYGTFDAYGSLSRAECAAMVARLVRSGLRLSFAPESYAPFEAAYLTPSTVMFENGITAEDFLHWVNTYIANEEASAPRGGREFNWLYVDLNGKTTLQNVKAAVLEALGVTAAQGTQAYKDFDYQVYYSRLIDLTGETLEPDYAVGVGA